MTHGHRRLLRQQQRVPETPKRSSAAAAAAETGFAVRSLAVNALACTGAAVSVLTPVHAVTLGEITVESALGQPLNARVPVTLAPGEFLSGTCITAPTTGASDLTRLPRPQIGAPETAIPGSYDLRITTARPLYEPMYELQLQIRCAGTALLVRQYVLMLDLPGVETQSVPAVQSLSTVTPPVASTASPAMPVTESVPAAPQSRARGHRGTHPATPIASGSQYRVQKGDTLSTIAARVINRGGSSIWTVADRIFAANPQAFIGSSPDLIRLGAEIDIPSSAATPVVAEVAASSTPPAQAPARTAETPQTAVSETPALEESGVAPAETSSVTVAAAPSASASVIAIAASDTPTAVFQDEQKAPEVVEVTAVAKPAAPPARDTTGNSPAWLAALVGVLIGVGASFALLRERLVEALMGLGRRRGTGATVDARAAPQAARRFLPRESLMVVEEARADAENEVPRSVARTDRGPAMPPAATQAFADPGPNTELASLFAGEPEAPLSATQAVGEPQPIEELDLDLTGAATEMRSGEEIDWIGDETMLSPTQRTEALAATAGGDTAEQLDLQSLAHKAATGDQELSQTLKDALSLLESDYESELTASQVVDRSKMERLVGGGDGDDTLARTGTDRNRRR